MSESIGNTAPEAAGARWPALPLEAWQETYATLHMWTQIVGKIRKTLTPLVNHWWNVPLYVSPRGLTTSVIHFGTRVFDIEFDFVVHQLVIRTGEGATRVVQLRYAQSRISIAKSCGIWTRLASMSVSTRRLTRSPIRFLLRKTTSMLPMIGISPIASGAFWLPSMRRSKNSGRGSSGSAARYISSGAVSIWR